MRRLNLTWSQGECHLISWQLSENSFVHRHVTARYSTRLACKEITTDNEKFIDLHFERTESLMNEQFHFQNHFKLFEVVDKELQTFSDSLRSHAIANCSSTKLFFQATKLFSLAWKYGENTFALFIFYWFILF